MKILSYTPDRATPEPAPHAAAPDPTSGLQAELNALAIQKLSEEFEAFKSVLTDTLADLRQSIEKLETAKAVAVPVVPMPAPLPAPEPVTPQLPREIVLDKIGGTASVAVSERKVAFFSKVWDYLNQAAIEVPSRKKD